MSSYEVEHNINASESQTANPEQRRRRPSLSTFFSTLSEIEVPEGQQQNAHATPLPANIVAAFRLLANALQTMRVDTVGGQEAGEGTGRREEEEEDDDDDDNDDQEVGRHAALLDGMIGILQSQADDPPDRVRGVSDEWLDGLDRVPKGRLRKGQDCPICGQPFLDDKYPLVVVLPCHPDHKFDLECIRPWLKVNPTCPLDRKDLLKKKDIPPPPKDEEEEDYDDYFA